MDNGRLMRRVGFDVPTATVIDRTITYFLFRWNHRRNVGFEIGNRPNVWCDEFWDLVNGFAQFIYSLRDSSSHDDDDDDKLRNLINLFLWSNLINSVVLLLNMIFFVNFFFLLSSSRTQFY